MKSSFRIAPLGWMIVPLVALSFLAWSNYVRVQRVEYVTGLVAEPLIPDAHSLTGYASGRRRLIIPEHNNDSYHWIAQTQQMFAKGEWRVRRVDYDNASFGRPVDSSSPYRWWLGMVAWCDQAVSGRPLGASVERVALFADPLLHLILIAGGTIFVAWQFGGFPAALFAAGVSGLFPFAAGFVPGAPDDRGLFLACAIWSVLPLIAGLRAHYQAGLAGKIEATKASRGTVQRWFFFAGVTGGLGMWVNVAYQVPIIVGIVLGGMIAAWLARSKARDLPTGALASSAWVAWATGGALTVFLAYLIEFFPDHLGAWQLRSIHPLYGLAWLGMGLVLGRVTAWIQRESFTWSVGVISVLVLAIAAIAVLPVVMWKMSNEGFLAAGLISYQLTKLAGGSAASSPWAWLLREGFSPTVWITLLPVALILPAGWLIVRQRTAPLLRAATAVALGPVLVALGFAGWRLNWWSVLDGLLLVLLVAITGTSVAERSRRMRWLWSGMVAFIVLLGAFQLKPAGPKGDANDLGEPELVGLIERDMAYWLENHTGGGAVVLTTPRQTTPLYYYGSLRGIGTMALENKVGIEAAVRILSASTPEEAKELIDRRGITHLVIPSWDKYLDEYARIGMGQLEGTFLNGLHLWRVPPWLRPVAYHLPSVKGFDGLSVKILEVVEEQGDAVALSRTAVYFVEMEQLEQAGAVGQALRRFPADLGSLVARAEVEIARGNLEEFSRTVELLRSRLANKGDRNLLWDRRVGLGIVLARSKQMDLARIQVQRCLSEMTEAKLRLLTTGSLYRLLVLGKAFDLKIADSQLRARALDLLPADLRSRF